MQSSNCFISLIFSLREKYLMFFDYIYASILAIVQGITEFIPVSSSSHLIIFSKISNFNYRSLEMDIGLHLGSLLAIILYFRKDLLKVKENSKVISLILLGSLPLIIIGFIVYFTGLINLLRDIKIIAWTTLLFGILLFISDKSKIKFKLEKDLNYKNIFFIGIFQCLALIPGVSRSGITITASRFLNFDRYESSKIAFYLSIPALFGASILGLKDMINQNLDFSAIIIFSSFLSFIISYITIKYFLKYVKNYSLNIFVYYRIFLSFLLLVIVYN